MQMMTLYRACGLSFEHFIYDVSRISKYRNLGEIFVSYDFHSLKESQPLGLIIDPIAKTPSEGLFNLSSRIQKDPCTCHPLHSYYLFA